jgi:uncharacterized protein (TIGR01319 family)
MAETRFPSAPNEFCITDVGSTTTKALLFLNQAGTWRCFRYETPTTVEKPHEDVTVGVLLALRGLERQTGRTLVRNDAPAVPYLTTSSAGGGLAMVVTGLVKEMTAETADRTALGAGAIVLDVLAMNDGRSPYRKIEDLKRLRPDMVLFAGGFDADAVSGPVFLAELLLEADLRPKLNPQAKLPVVYAGNVNAADFVRTELADRFLFHATPNVRPDLERENLEPARRAILDLFMDHVMSQAPGYEKLKEWVAAPIMPTPAAFAGILGLMSRTEARRVLAVDVGGATTDVFTARDGDVFRTVSANLGLSYSILNVAELAGIGPIRELYHPHLSDAEMWNRIGNKHINPTRLARTPDEMLTEWAAAAIAIREAVRQHLKLWAGSTQEEGPVRKDLNDLLREPRTKRPKRPPLKLTDYDLMVGSGGVLSHSPRPAAAAVLIDALDPAGAVELAVDSEFMFPHLGVLASVNPELALELFSRLGLVRLGPVGDFRRKGGTGQLLPKDYVPPQRADAAVTEDRVTTGEVRMTRELAIPGQVLVTKGTRVASDTLVARSERQFLRPFFLHTAEGLEVGPDEVREHMVKKVGDQIATGDILARRARHWLPDKLFHSPVDGRLEKILADGTLVVREKPEHGREFTAVSVAKELGVEPDRLAPYLRVVPGQEVERGQWLAADIRPGQLRHVESPVRGKVNRIDRGFGIVLIEPLLEELEVKAWLPGVVESVSDRGCTLAGSGTVITGVWGSGGEKAGILTCSAIAPGKVVVRDFADASTITEAKERAVAGLICAGVNLQDVLEPNPPFTIVVLEGFGEQRLPDDVRRILTGHEGRLALLDGTTQLRVGVRRPRIVLPAGE